MRNLDTRTPPPPSLSLALPGLHCRAALKTNAPLLLLLLLCSFFQWSVAGDLVRAEAPVGAGGAVVGRDTIADDDDVEYNKKSVTKNASGSPVFLEVGSEREENLYSAFSDADRVGVT